MQISTIPSIIIENELSQKAPLRRTNGRSPLIITIKFFSFSARRALRRSVSAKNFSFRGNLMELFTSKSRKNERHFRLHDGKAEKFLLKLMQFYSSANICNSIYFPSRKKMFKNAVKKSSETCRGTSGAHSLRDCVENETETLLDKLNSETPRMIYEVQFIIIPAHYTNLCETLTPSFPTRNYGS